MKEIIEEISINKIHPSPWQPRKRLDEKSPDEKAFDEQKLKEKEMGDSLIAKGTIQPIVVRKDKNDPTEYEIIAGERRWRACKLIGKETIPVIIKDVDDFTAREMSGVENWHRKDLSSIEKETYIYNLYTDGIKSGRYVKSGKIYWDNEDKGYSDMARKTGISNLDIYNLIEAYEARQGLKDIVLSEKVQYNDLLNTKSLQESPEVREELLKMRIQPKDKRLTQKDVYEVALTLTKIVPEEQKKVMNLISKKQLQAKDVPQFVELLKESAPDIQEMLLNQEITVDEAEVVKVFHTPEQRKQILYERRAAVESFLILDERHIERRKQQADSMEIGIEPILLTDDIRNWRKQFPEAHKDLGEDLYLRRCQNFFIDAAFYNADFILHIVDKERQKRCIEIGKRLSSHFSRVVHVVEQKSIENQKELAVVS